MWLRYHARAQRDRARGSSTRCGFDSIPHDLGVLYTVDRLPEGVPIKVEGFVRANGTFSGGTYHSAVEILGRLRQGRAGRRASAARLEPRPPGRHRQGPDRAARTSTRPAAAGWSPRRLIDPLVVLRSARALDRYGPEFRYGHYIVVKRLPTLGGARRPASATLAALAQAQADPGPAAKYTDQGDGPSEPSSAQGRGSTSGSRARAAGGA